MSSIESARESLERLNQLNQSWNEAFLPEATLVVKGGQPLFEKYQGTFWDFFKREKAEFDPAMQTVRELFRGQDTRDPLIRELQERINRLGQIIYVRRDSCICSLFCSPNLAAVQIRFPNTTELPPVGIIERGLPNNTFTLCWLNAAIMLFATVTHYDALFSTSLSDEKNEQLRIAFFRLIEGLRRNLHQSVIKSLHHDVIEQMKDNALCTDLMQGQQDPTEFIIRLQQVFSYERPKDELVQMVVMYKSEDSEVFRPGKEELPTIPLIVYPIPGKKINLQELLETEASVKGISEYYQRPNGSFTQGEGKNFVIKTLCTFFPSTVVIYIKRGDHVQNDEKFQVEVPDQKIEIIDGKVTLIQYEKVMQKMNDKEVIMATRPIKRCDFQVRSGIVRTGGTTDFGHCKTCTVTPKGVKCYSDMLVTSNQSPAILEDSYLLVLERVGEEVIHPSSLTLDDIIQTSTSVTIPSIQVTHVDE